MSSRSMVLAPAGMPPAGRYSGGYPAAPCGVPASPPLWRLAGPPRASPSSVPIGGTPPSIRHSARPARGRGGAAVRAPSYAPSRLSTIRYMAQRFCPPRFHSLIARPAIDFSDRIFDARTVGVPDHQEERVCGPQRPAKAAATNLPGEVLHRPADSDARSRGSVLTTSILLSAAAICCRQMHRTISTGELERLTRCADGGKRSVA